MTATLQPTDRAADDPIIGIDLGTTNSLAAYADRSGVRVLADDAGRPLLPSVVRLSEDGQSVECVGHEAREHSVEFSSRTVHSVKRLMGRSLEELASEIGRLPYAVVGGPRQSVRVRVAEREWSPEEISAQVLMQLKRMAESRLGRTVRRAVVTVPAYFDDAQRQATRHAGRLAGLQVVRIVNEPTAAAMAYHLGMNQRRKDRATGQAGGEGDGAPSVKVGVFDLGGGTFDFSVLKLQQTEKGLVDRVLATAGDTQLGGDDLDHAIVERLCDQLKRQTGSEAEPNLQQLQQFRLLAESMKVRLSEVDSAEAVIDLGEDRSFTFRLTRDELEQLAGPLLDRALTCCERALRRAGMDWTQLDHVVLVGGSTRMPLVRNVLRARTGMEPYTALDPDQVVAMGAAVQASILAGFEDRMLLLDVVPLSLGIETLGGAVSKVIMANTTVPARATERFSTHVDGQTSIMVHVLQGERELVKDCRSLGRFTLKGVPPMPAGLPILDVTFTVDANGILTVSAVERRSERRAAIQVAPHFGLSEEEVSRMEAEGVSHALEDMRAHRLIDLRNQAKLDLRQIERQLSRVGHRLEDEERQQLEAAAGRLHELLARPDVDPDVLQKKLQELDHGSIRLAELAVAEALKHPERPEGA